MKVKFTLKDRDGIAFGYYFDCGECTFLELFDQQGAVKQWGGEIVALKSPSGTFYQHFCLELEGIEAFRARLIAHGISVTAITVGLDNSKQCWIKDPDNNSIELMEYTPASLQIQNN